MSLKKLLVGGFPELLPHEQLIFNEIKETIEKSFKSFGFVNIETPAVERNKVLTAKGGGEISKQIFGLYGLAQGCEKDTKDYSLHFDLTVPLARYIVDYKDKIVFPFKRYQIQKVRRGERHQRGRFREFYQCDVDVIDKKEINNYTEAETIITLMTALVNIFKYLDIEENIELHINDRKFIDELISYFNLSNKSEELLKLFDDFYKIPYDDFKNKLLLLLGNDENKLNEFLGTLDNIRKSKLTNNFKYSENLIKLYKTLEDLVKINELDGKIKIKIDPFIVRGLDYYTGTVFETFIEGRYGFGSICSGGRYDNLVDYIASDYNIKSDEYKGFGGSIGLTRLFSRLKEIGAIDNIKKYKGLSDVIVFNVPNSSLKYKHEIANILRKANINVEVYGNEDKLSKQFKYADAKNIPVGIFVGEEEESKGIVKIKDLKERDVYEVKVEEVVNKVKELLIKNF